MGLGPAFLMDLIELKRSGSIDGATRVLEIGAQQLSDLLLNADPLLDELYGLFGRQRPFLGAPLNRKETFEQHRDAPSSRQFWTSLGFSYSAVEYDDYQDVIRLDLNNDVVPDGLRRAFDLVVNAGTTEHVANQGNAFRIIHNFTREGGVMYHEVPAGGMMTHGLFNYTPKFFWRLCQQNDYEIISMKICSWPEAPVPEDLKTSNSLFAKGVDYIGVGSIADFSIRATL